MGDDATRSGAILQITAQYRRNRLLPLGDLDRVSLMQASASLSRDSEMACCIAPWQQSQAGTVPQKASVRQSSLWIRAATVSRWTLWLLS